MGGPFTATPSHDYINNGSTWERGKIWWVTRHVPIIRTSKWGKFLNFTNQVPSPPHIYTLCFIFKESMWEPNRRGSGDVQMAWGVNVGTHLGFYVVFETKFHCARIGWRTIWKIPFPLMFIILYALVWWS